jgi:phosphoserine aminotransferase
LGGEAQHGILVLSPRAVERLESFVPPRPLPKIFRMTKGGKFNEAIFEGDTINTPSMLCVEDALDGLNWAQSVGGLKGLIARSEGNLQAVADWVRRTDWVDFLAEDPKTRSCTSICLKLVAPAVSALGVDEQWGVVRRIAAQLDGEGVAYDIAGHRDAVPHIRIWGGATIERADIDALLPWLDWAYAAAMGEISARV